MNMVEAIALETVCDVEGGKKLCNYAAKKKNNTCLKKCISTKTTVIIITF